MAGYGGLMFAADEAHVTNIAIAPGRAPPGPRAHLLAELAREGTRRQCAAMTLEVRMGNIAGPKPVPEVRLCGGGRSEELLPRNRRGRLHNVAPRAAFAGGPGAPEGARRTAVKVLAIETSCDETAAAVVEDGTRVLSSVVSSQTDIHAIFGGVVPEIASRAHLELVGPVVAEAMNRAGDGPRGTIRGGGDNRAGPGRFVARRSERGKGVRLVVGPAVRGREPHGGPPARRFP